MPWLADGDEDDVSSMFCSIVRACKDVVIVTSGSMSCESKYQTLNISIPYKNPKVNFKVNFPALDCKLGNISSEILPALIVVLLSEVLK